MFSITDQIPFNQLVSLIESIESIKGIKFADLPGVIVGNKADLESERKVNFKQGQILAQKFNKMYVETSFKLGMNGGVPLEEVVHQSFSSTLREPNKFGSLRTKHITIAIIGSIGVGKSNFSIGVSEGLGYRIEEAIFPRNSEIKNKLIYPYLAYTRSALGLKKKMSSVFKKEKKNLFDKVTKDFQLSTNHSIQFSQLMACCIYGN